DHPRKFSKFKTILKKMANLESVEIVDKKVNGAIHFVHKADEFYIPTTEGVDISKQIGELREALHYTEGFLESVIKKLSNKKFVDNAPESVVEMERKKKEDAEAKIRTLKESLEMLTRK
ncbi:MAG TPA: hypothetical protein VI583_15105, partial [Cyclobacteriaceae bacterium]|nr:hypothetical protein [Cyclobacteriaceae bacterium]